MVTIRYLCSDSSVTDLYTHLFTEENPITGLKYLIKYRRFRPHDCTIARPHDRQPSPRLRLTKHDRTTFRNSTLHEAACTRHG